LVKLNLATRQWHAAVDDGWLDLLRPTVTVADYLSQLVRTYGLVAPFEGACRYTPGFSRLVEYGQLNRAGLIAHDLLALNVSASQLANVPICASITVFNSVAEALGWLYVVERTTLLADGLTRHIHHVLPQVANATIYLDTFAKRSTEHWQQFGREIDRALADPQVSEETVAAACSAFQLAQTWFRPVS
jgi:heme oxygenase